MHKILISNVVRNKDTLLTKIFHVIITIIFKEIQRTSSLNINTTLNTFI